MIPLPGKVSVRFMKRSSSTEKNREFKLGAVKLVLEEGKSIKQVAMDLGIPSSTLNGWVRRFKSQQGKPLPGSGRHKPDDELSLLREENRLLKMERDILKKTLPLFMERMK